MFLLSSFHAVRPIFRDNPAFPGFRGNPVSVGDEIAAHELRLYADSTAELYPMKQGIIANLEKKLARGTYQVPAAVGAWEHWFERAAKMYAREFASPGEWNRIFTRATRTLAAREEEAVERAEMEIRLRKPPGAAKLRAAGLVPVLGPVSVPRRRR